MQERRLPLIKFRIETFSKKYISRERNKTVRNSRQNFLICLVYYRLVGFN